MNTSNLQIADLHSLAFDVGRIVEELRGWVECESPTWDAPAVNAMGSLVAGRLERMGATVSRLRGQDGLGDIVRAELPHPRMGVPGILMLGHLDTVHPIGTLRASPWRESDGKCYGPGVFDMKGGLLIALEAMAALRRAGRQTALPVTVILNSDEEIGSPTSRAVIEREAGRQRYVLIAEPARRNGGVVVGRYAISRFSIRTTGRPSHAGLHLREGCSAIHEMANQILSIDSMTEDANTFSVGVVKGGQWVNCVSTRCTAEVLVVSKTEQDRVRARERLDGLRPHSPGSEIFVDPGPVRPVWEPNAAGERLYERASDIARSLGLDLPSQVCGGGSDGNFTGALGIATLDALGPCGDGAHTLDEHIVTASLESRFRLIAGLLSSLS